MSTFILPSGPEYEFKKLSRYISGFIIKTSISEASDLLLAHDVRDIVIITDKIIAVSFMFFFMNSPSFCHLFPSGVFFLPAELYLFLILCQSAADCIK